MATKAFEKFQEQLKSIKDNEAFTKSDTNKDLKKVRQEIKQIVSSILSSVKGQDIDNARIFLADEIAQMRFLNNAYLKVKAIDRLIDRAEIHGNKYIVALEKNQEKEILKVAKKHISTSKKSSKESASATRLEKELAKLKEMDYFTCSESDCSCNDVFLCDCSESECSCSESDNEIDEKTVKRLRKLNRQLRASSKKENKKERVSFKVPSKLAQAEVVFDDDTDSASSSEDFDYESFKSLLKQSNTRLENMSDSSKINLVFKNLKSMYNKLSYTNRNKFTSQMELLDALYN
jgi:hypothetical protein